ncbi:MAG: fibronectin type III domain-containing protein [Verrucomicrobiia bacterium]
MNRRTVFTLTCLLGLLPLASAADSRFQHFITRKGDKLMDGDKEFRFIGANMPGLLLPYDYTLFLKERMTLPTPWEQEDGVKTLAQMNLRVARTWCLAMRGPREQATPWHYILGPGQLNEEAFRALDHLLALGHRYGVRYILSISAAQDNFLGGFGTFAAHRGKKRQEFWTDPQLKQDFKDMVRLILERRNSITGGCYKDDKAVFAWQFGNEMEDAPEAWCAEMAAFIKSLDPNHLIIHTWSSHRPDPARLDPNIDIFNRHYYPGREPDYAALCREETLRLKHKQPFVIGEFGPYVDGKQFTRDNAGAKLREFLAAVEDSGAAGALLWSMYSHHRDGGFYWHQIFTYPAVWAYHWPGFPSADAQDEIGIMTAMREAAFRIQGQAVPPVAVPDAPTLLPIGGVPMISWRGSAGASGYDIERAPKAGGPWKTIAKNVSDADIAYRPLFSDTTARTGQTWFYRVTARNVSGASQPSNVVGPVKVKRVCLADELQDFSRVHAKSDGLKLNNDYNAFYAEYLFRAKGNTNDWLSYKVSAPIESVKVVTFFAKDTADLTLQVSDDGRTFTALQPARIERRLASPPSGPARGQRRTMVEYECAVPAGNRCLKLLWNGPAELDRVEIYEK